MTQDSDPYENAVAERVNGILKQEFNIDRFNVDLKSRKVLVQNAIKVYNKLRPHYSNYYLTTEQMHHHKVLIPRTYKRKNSKDLKIFTVL